MNGVRERKLSLEHGSFSFEHGSEYKITVSKRKDPALPSSTVFRQKSRLRYRVWTKAAFFKCSHVWFFEIWIWLKGWENFLMRRKMPCALSVMMPSTLHYFGLCFLSLELLYS